MLLSRVRSKDLGPNVLESLTKRSRENLAVFLQNDLEIKVEQSHDLVEGSIEEALAKIYSAYFRWADSPEVREQFDYCFTYGTILAVLGDSLIVAKQTWLNAGGYDWDYYRIKYSVTNGSVVIATDSIEEVDVAVVVKELDANAEPVEQSQPTAEAKISDIETPTESTVKNQETQAHTDTVTDESKLVDKALGEGGGHSAPVATEGDAAANSPGAGVQTPTEAASSATTSTTEPEGTTPATDHGSDDEVEEALAKTAAGLKQSEQSLIQSMACDMHQQSLSYIEQSKVEEKDGKKLMRIQGIATKADVMNAAGQVYPLSVWEKNLPNMNKLAQAGKFLGKVEHPDEENGLQDAAIKFDKFRLQGNELWFNATIIPTEPHGKNLQAMIEAGVQVDISSRGYGSVKQSTWRGQDAKLIQDDFVCVAFDAVMHAASPGSAVKSAKVQSKDHSQGDESVKQALTPAQEKSQKLQTSALFASALATLLQEAAGSLSDIGKQAYEQALRKAASIDELAEISTTSLPLFQSAFAKPEESEADAQLQAETYSPQFFVKQSKEELAPKTVGELFRRLVQDLPDRYPGQDAPVGNVPNHLASPREACYRLLCNIAREHQGPFSGRQAALGLLALEQGKVDRAQDILTQSLATGSTVAASNADGDGAPLSAPMIFPLVRRVFPRYIMNEIASIQPMDRPEGKIFYLDHYRTQDPSSEKRADLNTSASPFNSSYGDNDTEGATAKLIRLRLASVTIDAHNKKLGAAWSIEEMQDLRAYHGLDAAQELMGGLAREVALEWNMEVLNDMLAQATAAALTFGRVKPATGFTDQPLWDAYLWNYLQKLDNEIFAKRNGPMTHIIAGMDAALDLAKSMRGAFTIGDDQGDLDLYPGVSFFPITVAPNGSRYRVLKTNFWAPGTTNGGKILGIRRGTEWSDTPYVFAPYTDYVTPQLTDPSDFSQKQGILSRAAKKVVVADAMGTVTCNSSTGVAL